MDFSAALPTFLVTLREGFEAALVVGIVGACLKKAQQTRLYPWVFGGVLAGIAASVLVGLGLGGILQRLAASNALYAPVFKEFLEAGFGIFAIAMLSWMLIWMTQQAKFLKTEVEGAIAQALEKGQGAAWGVFALIFIAVAREGFETVVFIVAKFQDGWLLPSIGAIAGLTLATGMGVLLFVLGIKINIRLFFQVMGIFLLLIVGGLVVGVLKHLDGAIALLAQLNPQYAKFCLPNSPSCILGSQVWNLAQILPDKEFPGIVLKALFGYRQQLFLVQAIAYLGFLMGVGGVYLQSLGVFSRLGNLKRSEASQ
ncbi:FTR1 family protein [Lusitaniella coriacea LEGE 07157]|uniref:FTR1 family protein n=1 Tax=Lusitaniella coriacea LEGE 07157 TaxID=945747 RepID=A0A8J7E086_9CYAN|nr:FTR1 family protein [Lusitaniella coriacea]MBE9118610.1 FTR1 family protein [Lusitaniella coriacea LEGE 07157]